MIKDILRFLKHIVCVVVCGFTLMFLAASFAVKFSQGADIILPFMFIGLLAAIGSGAVLIAYRKGLEISGVKLWLYVIFVLAVRNDNPSRNIRCTSRPVRR